MRKQLFVPAAAAAAILALSGAALAQTAVVATTDLNVRSGPGPQFEVVGVIGASQPATLMGCIENSRWCQVDVGGTQGWAYSEYLAADSGGTQVVISQQPAGVTVPTVTYETTASTGGAVAGATTGAVAGALVAGPVGAAVGGVAGAATGGALGAAIDPPEQIRTYVTSNPTETVYLDGEVVVGAGLPENVVVREIPDYEYRYVYVNGQPVLVEPESRRIVYVVR